MAMHRTLQRNTCRHSLGHNFVSNCAYFSTGLADGFIQMSINCTKDPRVNLTDHLELAIEASVMHGHIHVFDFLCDQMAQEKKTHRDYLLHLMEVSVRGGQYLMLEHLTNKPLARPLLQDWKIEMLVNVAIQEGDYHMTKLLLQKIRCGQFYADRDAVYSAAKRGDYHMLKLLLENNGLTASHDPYEPTPIHVAASKGHVECIKILLAAGYTPLEKHYRDEFTTSAPITEAKIHRQLEVLKLFKDDPTIGEEKVKIEQYLAAYSCE